MTGDRGPGQRRPGRARAGGGRAAGGTADRRPGRPRPRLDRADRRPHRRPDLPGGAGQPGPRRGRLAPGRRLVGRRAVPARRAPGPQRDPGAGGAARRAAARPGPGAPDAGLGRPGRTPTRRRPPPGTRTSSPASARPGTARLPHFDLLLLGVGEDGHVASVFPEHPAAYETRPVAGVRGSPKPPPIRITLTLPAINTAEEVWLIAAGPEKAGAVGMALTGAGPVQLPAAGVHGVERTLWLLDRAAAGRGPSPQPSAACD